MRPATIHCATFIIMQGSTSIAGTVAPTSNDAVFTFAPTVPFSPFAVYAGTITNSVKNTLGSAMVSNYIRTFTTIPRVKLSPLPVAGGTTTGFRTFAQGSAATVTTLTPVAYKSASGTFKITSGDLTPDAQGNQNVVWIFQAAVGLTAGIASPAGARSIILTNEAQAQNVYWYVGSAATINAAVGGIMVGTIIALPELLFY